MPLTARDIAEALALPPLGERSDFDLDRLRQREGSAKDAGRQDAGWGRDSPHRPGSGQGGSAQAGASAPQDVALPGRPPVGRAPAEPALSHRAPDPEAPPIRAAFTGRQRPAAVLCALLPRAGALQVVLIRRALHLRQHAGQIAFPGGKVDATDASPLAAALREAHEEVGLIAGEVDVLGTLDPYLTSTGYRITPFVGLVDPRWRPMPDPAEVELVFEAPLDFLMDPANRHEAHLDRDGRRRHFYEMPWRGHHIWGATAGMLKGLSDRIEALPGLRR
jgi:8-oxo-dGTP pyrophosphatase MutT (NUDIX family)